MKFFNKLCARIILKKFDYISYGYLKVHLLDDTIECFGNKSSTPVNLYVKNEKFFLDLLLGGNIGLGESYTKEYWDTDNLTNLICLFIKNIEQLKKNGLNNIFIKKILLIFNNLLKTNTKKQSKKNIYAHYDLGNDFYKLFLDKDTMMYSSAIFDKSNITLGNAQKNKLQKIIKLSNIQSHHHVLEIGCGWGGFAIEAVRSTGCLVTAITISKEQYIFAKQKIKEEGLEHKIDIQLCDYRDIKGSFDRIVSIEMLEAIGKLYYGKFFKKCDKLLNKEGKVFLQVITIPDQRFDAYARNPDWIQKHIFPGGALPSLFELSKSIKKSSSMQIQYINNIGIHYAQTLNCWRTSFENQHDRIQELGFNDVFFRKWIYYLSYCEAGFKTTFINDLHIILQRPNDNENND